MCCATTCVQESYMDYCWVFQCSYLPNRWVPDDVHRCDATTHNAFTRMGYECQNQIDCFFITVRQTETKGTLSNVVVSEHISSSFKQIHTSTTSLISGSSYAVRLQ